VEFGQILRKMRKEAGFSQEELAEELHISRSNISRLETNNLELKASDLVNWCNVTNAQEVLIAFLLGADGIGMMQQILDIMATTSTLVGTILLGGIL